MMRFALSKHINKLEVSGPVRKEPSLLVRGVGGLGVVFLDAEGTRAHVSRQGDRAPEGNQGTASTAYLPS